MLAPAFSYYGSKASKADWLIGLMAPHHAYIEPYAGSAAVMLRKEPSQYEVLNDLNGYVVNFYRVLRQFPTDLGNRLTLTPYSREEYLFCRDNPDCDDPIERARRFFVRSCLSFNSSGAAVGYSSGSRFKGSKPRTFARRIDDRLLPVAERLRSVEIENLPAVTLLERWNYSGTLVYLDPPYLNLTRRSFGDYAVDGGDEPSHLRLLDLLQNFKGKVLLSGYPSSLYDGRLCDWNRFSVDCYVPTSNGDFATEVCWRNF